MSTQNRNNIPTCRPSYTWNRIVLTRSGQYTPPVGPHANKLFRPAACIPQNHLHCTYACDFDRKLCSTDSIPPPFCICTLTARTSQLPLNTTTRVFVGDAPLHISRYEEEGSNYWGQNRHARFAQQLLHHLLFCPVLGVGSWRSSVTLGPNSWFTECFPARTVCCGLCFDPDPGNSLYTQACSKRAVLPVCFFNKRVSIFLFTLFRTCW